ncbi:MAG: stage II sporulation protein M [Candidatus Woesearchaeota archaeon]
MVLESLLDPKKAEERPWELFFLGVAYASFALVLSLWVFKGYASIVMVSLTAICSVPLIYNIIKKEAEKDESKHTEFWLMKEHGKAVTAFTFLFLGFVAAFLIWFIILPSTTVQSIFEAQIATISHITATPTGSVVNAGAIGGLLLNNMKILIFCFLFSFFFGAGAIFILTWNASVVATAIGAFVRNNVLSHAGGSIAAYSQLISLGILKYMTHGVFEIVAYFIGALAGGIFSVAVIRHDFKTSQFRKTLLDSIDIFLIAAALLVVAAGVEVFVTPFIA